MPICLVKPKPLTDADKAQGAPKRRSLSFMMIRMLLLCWVLPVMLLILLGGSALRQSLIEQSVESLSLSVQGASQLSSLRLESAITASRNASYIGTIKQAWSDYLIEDDKVALFQTSRTFLEQQYQNDSLFRSTILLYCAFEEEPIYIINGAAGGTDRVRNHADEIMATAQSISETLDTGIGFFSVGERVFLMRNLVDSRYQTIAILMMELNTDLIFAEFGQIPNTEYAIAYLNEIAVTQESTVSAPNNDGQTSADTTEGADAADWSEYVAQAENYLFGAQSAATEQNEVAVQYAEGALHTTVQHIGADYTFAYYAVTSPDILKEQWDIVLALLLVLFVLMLPLGALVYRFFAMQVNRPIRLMTREAKKIRRQEYGVQIPPQSMQSSEFVGMCEDFNEMSLTLQEQFEHIYKEEIALRDARMMALQSQINPHFLNNTLEIINWEARMQGNLKVCNMIESLSTMLSAAMDRNSNRNVHLSKELMYVDAYLYIINERLGKRLVFERDIPDEFLDVMVPRLVLQPLLENAVEHGITPVQQGRIALRARREGDWLVLSVENDGALSDENLTRIQTLLAAAESGERVSSGSLGLRNVHQRLRILYGEESGLLVDTTKKDKTVFKLKVKLDQV